MLTFSIVASTHTLVTNTTSTRVEDILPASCMQRQTTY